MAMPNSWYTEAGILNPVVVDALHKHGGDAAVNRYAFLVGYGWEAKIAEETGEVVFTKDGFAGEHSLEKATDVQVANDLVHK